MELRDNKIIIEINDNTSAPSATRERQPDDKGSDDVSKLLREGANLPNGLPVIGEYSSKFSSLYSKTSALIGQAATIGTGGLGAVVPVASLVVAALNTAHAVASSYVKTMRQSAELQRRAGIRRNQ